MRSALLRTALFALILVGTLESVAFAQGGSAKSTLSGTVADTAGGVIPGATVVVRNAATSLETATVTNATGVFDVPALDAGTYTITISLSGFKTSVLTDVELLAATTRSVKVTLDVGALAEAVEVRGGAQLVQTQSTAISSTIRTDQMTTLPLVARNALNFVVFLPGVDTSASNHSQRSSTIMGLPQSALSITVDGSSVQDKYARSGDGFFANLQPRLDMVEEVTVSSATAGAESSGQGSVQIKFVTRSGTNKFVGSAYEYTRHQNLNSNTFFNMRNGLPRNVIILNQYGAREGGPIVIPGWYDGRGKSFFFVNMEQLRYPLSNTRTRGILTPQAQQGVFRYAVAGAAREVNLFDVAARNAQTTTADPTIAALLTKIRSGASTTGVINNRTDLNVQDFVWQPESLRIDNVPTVRLDFNLGVRHRLSTSYSYQGQRLTPNLFGGDEPNFPGLANQAELYSAISRSSTSLRSTFGKNLVNELRFGWSNGPVYFADSVVAEQFADQGGFDFQFPNNTGLSLANATTNRTHSSRNGKSWNLDNTINWLIGKHSLQFGESFTRTSGWMETQNLVPQLSFGVDATNDPANAMFVDANFPGASNQDLTNARALYGFLTGRVTQVGSEVRLDAAGRYVYMGRARTEEHQDELGLFVQDSWRLRPNVTINAGLRWQLAFPFKADLSVFSRNTFEDLCGVSGLGNGPEGRGCNLFNPGVGAGARVPTYLRYEGGDGGYKTEYTNFAPNVGVAWQPNVKDGWLRGLLGDPDLATLRASFGVAYNSDGLNFFRDVYNSNPGSTVSTSRTAASTQFPLVPAGGRWPLLLREPDRLGPSAGIPTEPVYPMAINFNSGVNLLDPSFRTPSTRSYSVGLQRALSTLMVVEVRYVGTRLLDGTTTENWNCAAFWTGNNNCTRNFTSNGFLDEFRLAQQNLQVAIGQGCGQAGRPACSFAYQGPGTGTHPLPIYLANFNGAPRAQAGEASRYTGANWTSAARLEELAARNPTPGAAVNALFGNATFRTNLEAAGFPRNFFVLNPDVSNAFITTNGRFTQYDSLQINLRRLLSAGLTVDANYTFATRSDSRLDSLREARRRVRSLDAVPHALKITTNYELPIGRDKRFASGANTWLNGVIGNWSLNLTGRVQSGSILNFAAAAGQPGATAANVRLVGMTVDELQDAFKVRIDPVTKIVYTLPQDIIENTIKAFSTSATSPTGYGALGAPSGRYLAPANGPDCIQEVRGDCAPADLLVEGPLFTRFDLNLKKRIPFAGTKSVDFGVDIFNIFNAINFTAIAETGAGATINQVNNFYNDPNVTFDPGGRLVQLVFRVNF
jgi:hypothetical protein